MPGPSSTRPSRAVIVGGGVAATSCALHLHHLSPSTHITLVDPSPSLRVCRALTHLSDRPLDVTVEASAGRHWCNQHNLHFHQGQVTQLHLDTVSEPSNLSLQSGQLHLIDHSILPFDILCLATGARPSVPIALAHAVQSGLALVVRDADSVRQLQQAMLHARRVVVVGAGGVGMELVHETMCEVVWIVRAEAVGGDFLDDTVSHWMTQTMDIQHKAQNVKEETNRKIGSLDDACDKCHDTHNVPVDHITAAAVGPHWLGRRDDDGGVTLFGASREEIEQPRLRARARGGVRVETRCEVVAVRRGGRDWRTEVELSDGEVIGCDMVVVGTGVHANTGWLVGSGVQLSKEDGGIIVQGEDMQSSIDGVFAAGDCTCVRERKDVDWVQMRTWTQALAGGRIAADGMAKRLGGEDGGGGLEFEVLVHATRFFGRRVVLLGRWGAQGLGEGFQVLESAGKREFIRAVVMDGKVRGALLVGDVVGRAEVFENLIAGKMDVTWLGERLVDEDFDIEDYFD